MHRFKAVYEDGGLIPTDIFGLRVGPGSPATGKCLTYKGAAGTSPDGRGIAVLEDCNSYNDRQWWHGANRDTSKAGQPCCSGLRAWNTDQCIAAVQGGRVETFVCEVDGTRNDQVWELSSDGLVRHKAGLMSHYCLEANSDA